MTKDKIIGCSGVDAVIGEKRGMGHRIHAPSHVVKKGFTLVEILVAMTILVIALAAIYTSFQGGLTSWAKGTARMERYLNARAALDMMSREIAAALLYSGDLDIHYCQGWNDGQNTDGDAPPKRALVLSDKDEFFFTAALEDGPCEVGYWLDDENTSRLSDDMLMRVYVTPGAATYDGDYQSGDNSNQLVLPVTDLQFEYFDGATATWVNTWNSKTGAQAGELPEAVRISMDILDETAEADTQVFSTIVYLPTGR